MQAAAQGHKEIVQLLISKGAEANAADKVRWGGEMSLCLCCLVLVVQDSYFFCVRVLTSTTHTLFFLQYGRTVLTFAAASGHKEIVELLIDRGAEVNATDGVRRGVTRAGG